MPARLSSTALARAAARVAATPDDVMIAFVRIALGGALLCHGLQQVAGLFDGAHLVGTVGSFVPQIRMPTPLAPLAIAVESLGAVALVVGLLGRVAALAVVALTAAAAVQQPKVTDLFMGWSGFEGGAGYEYLVKTLVLAAAVLVRGSGAWSLDRGLCRAVAQRAAVGQIADRSRDAAPVAGGVGGDGPAFAHPIPRRSRDVARAA